MEIAAPSENVWAVLSDVDAWPTWTASIDRVERLDGAPLGVGSHVRVKQPRFPAAEWTVTDWEPGKRFSWTARSGGVTTVGDHEVVAGAAGTTKATLRIHQTGPLAGIVAVLFGKRSRRYVQMEAEGLKRRSEHRP